MKPAQPARTGSSGARAGIGMSFVLDPQKRRYVIIRIDTFGPAKQFVAEGSISIGDALLKIEGSDVLPGAQNKNIENLIEGPEGTPVKLTFEISCPDGALGRTKRQDRVAAGEILPDLLHQRQAPRTLIDRCDITGAGCQTRREMVPQIGPDTGKMARMDGST